MKWIIEYDNETGCGDDGFSEYWYVTDGEKSFRSWKESEAVWLCETLNEHNQQEMNETL